MDADELAVILTRDRPQWRVAVAGSVLTVEDPRFGSTVVWELDDDARARLRRRGPVDRRMAGEGWGRGTPGRAAFVTALEEKLDTFTGSRGHIEVDGHGALRIVDDSPG